MTLRVTPDDLRGYGQQVGRTADDAHECRRYCDRHTSIPWEKTGLIGLIAATHFNTVSETNSALDRIREVLDAARDELRRSARYYELTDRRVAVQVDATYPVVDRPAPLSS
nr:type VII secretion target [Streptomyces sp. SID5785]